MGVMQKEEYLELGLIYAREGNLEAALKSLHLTERNRELIQELKRHGIRKKQVFSFLPRNHFLNRYVGLLLHWLRISIKTEGLRDRRADCYRVKS